jgi:hypothetical protein
MFHLRYNRKGHARKVVEATMRSCKPMKKIETKFPLTCDLSPNAPEKHNQIDVERSLVSRASTHSSIYENTFRPSDYVVWKFNLLRFFKPDDCIHINT